MVFKQMMGFKRDEWFTQPLGSAAFSRISVGREPGKQIPNIIVTGTPGLPKSLFSL